MAVRAPHRLASATSPRVLTPPNPPPSPPSPPPARLAGAVVAEEGPWSRSSGSVVVVVGKLADVTLVLSMATTTRRWAAL